MIENSTILVTGASRGLGKEISNLLTSSYKFKKLIVTSREPEKLNDIIFDNILKVKLNLSESPSYFYQNEFYTMLCNEDKIDYIFYCASPYYNQRLRMASKEHFVDLANIIGNNILALRELASKLSVAGCLIVSGAVGSERINSFTSFLKNGMGNISFGTLHSLHKGHVKDLMCCLFQEFKEKRLIHANISAFEDHLDPSKTDDCLTTRFVAEKLIFLALNDIKLENFNYDIFAKNVADRVDMIRRINIGIENESSIDYKIDKDNEIKKSFTKYYEKISKIQRRKLPGTLISINHATLTINLFLKLPEDVQNEILSKLIEFKTNKIQIKKGNLEFSKYYFDATNFKLIDQGSIVGKILCKNMINIDNKKEKNESIIFPDITNQKYSEKTESLLDFNVIFEKSKKFANFLLTKKEEIAQVLQKCECYSVAITEIEKAIDLLLNLDQNLEYFVKRVGAVASFLPINQPLYATVCFAIVPSFMTNSVYLRPPEIIHHTFKELIELLDLSAWFPNAIVSFKNRDDFVLSVKNEVDIVIFTGKPENAAILRKKFCKNCLFIMNGAGHNPIVIGEHADLVKAVECTVYACLYNQGQDCSSPNAILVKQSQLETFRKLLLDQLELIKNHIGPYSEKKNAIGPNNHIDQIFNIAKFIERNQKYFIFGGNLNLRTGLIEPVVIEKHLKEGPNFHEFFAPIIMIQPYDSDKELGLYFENEKYSKNAMYVSVFGESDFIKSLELSNRLHSNDNVLHDIDLHSVERGFLPFGGYGWAASAIYFNGQEIRGPTLVQREIFVYKVLGNFKGTKLDYIYPKKKEPDNTYAPWKRKLLIT